MKVAVMSEQGDFNQVFEEVDDNQFRDLLIDLLKKSVITVTFTKVDGTERVMNATLKPTLLPKKEYAGSSIDENLDVIRCYDIDNEGFRSFRVKSVTKFEVKDSING